jgi:hypothetical protein
VHHVPRSSTGDEVDEDQDSDAWDITLNGWNVLDRRERDCETRSVK